MEMYTNLGGNSGVASYELDSDSVTVQFNDGAIYLYNYVSAGRSNIETMKALAAAGQGLNSFIMKYARKSYAAKLR
jgi:hypothetical protein